MTKPDHDGSSSSMEQFKTNPESMRTVLGPVVTNEGQGMPLNLWMKVQVRSSAACCALTCCMVATCDMCCLHHDGHPSAKFMHCAAGNRDTVHIEDQALPAARVACNKVLHPGPQDTVYASWLLHLLTTRWLHP
jgi:hypothetical protein